MVQVYDQVNAGTNKPMAAASFDIGECLGARGNTTAKEMKDGGTYVQYDLTCGCSMNTIKNLCDQYWISLLFQTTTTVSLLMLPENRDVVCWYCK